MLSCWETDERKNAIVTEAGSSDKQEKSSTSSFLYFGFPFLFPQNSEKGPMTFYVTGPSLAMAVPLEGNWHLHFFSIAFVNFIG